MENVEQAVEKTLADNTGMTFEDVVAKGYKFLTQKEFCTRHGGITLSAVDYGIRRGNLDWVRIGTVRHIVLTPLTESYAPQYRPDRTAVMQTANN